MWADASKRSKWRAVFSVALLVLSVAMCESPISTAAAAAAAAAAASSLASPFHAVRPRALSVPERASTSATASMPRGGAREGVKRRKKRSTSPSAKPSLKKRGGRKKRRPPEGEDGGKEEEEESGRRAIDDAMKEGDAAAALGDAIRDRANVLRGDSASPCPIPPLSRADVSVASVGLALGTSDPSAGVHCQWRGVAAGLAAEHEGGKEQEASVNAGGGVEASPTAVLANYFLRTHGGAHGVQCLLSLLSVAAGISAVIVHPPPSPLPVDGRAAIPAKLVLLRRSLLCALAKHASGLTAAAAMSASRMSSVGFRGVRRTAELLALDPVGQYLFYCALLLVWTPSPTPRAAASGKSWLWGQRANAAAAGGGGPASAATVADSALVVPWWMSTPRSATYSTLCLLGPVLLREVVSTAWVVSDVSVLLATSSPSRSGREPVALRMIRGVIDAFMSLLLTPEQWRGANTAARQKILAKGISKTSLGLEILTGILIAYDAIWAFLNYALSAVTDRPNLAGVAKRMVCARLYINFLLVRQKKIGELVGMIRGGAANVPERVLDVLLEPRRTMGLEKGVQWGVDSFGGAKNGKGDKSPWYQRGMVALGL